MRGALQVRMNEVELARLQRLADDAGLNMQQIVKMLVKRAADELERRAQQQNGGAR